MAKFQGFLLILAGLGLVFAWLGYSDQELFARLDAVGKVTIGSIEKAEIHRGRRGSRTYYLTVRYEPEGKAAIEHDFQVTRPFFESVAANNTLRVDTCQIRYVPDEPTEAIVVGGTRNQADMLPMGTGLTAAGSLGFFVVRRRRKATELAQTPSAE